MGYTPPQLYVNKISGGWQLFPPTYTSTDDLKISANGTDAYPYILMYGNDVVKIYFPTGSSCQFLDGTALAVKISYTTPDAIISTNTDKNLYLLPVGTGLVKFGTYAAGAATDSTGYITILDAAGNTRKLMVQA